MKSIWIAAGLALFHMPGPAAAQAQGTVPAWKPMTLIPSTERGPLPDVLDKGFSARQAKLHVRRPQISAIPEKAGLPPIKRTGIPGVISEILPPPKP